MRYKLVACMVALQMFFFLGWIAFEQGLLDIEAPAYIRVRTVPVDPRDYLSGQYMVLSYEFSVGSRWNEETKTMEPLEFVKQAMPQLKPGQVVWVYLHPSGDVYVPYRISSEKSESLPVGNVAFRGRYINYNRFEYGIEKYFFPETLQQPDMKDVTVELKVTSRGIARVNRIFVQGNAWLKGN